MIKTKDFPEIIFDEIGPEYIVQIYDPELEFRGVLVIDNLNLGVGKGGIRMMPNITVTEVFRLARAMTFKNALAGLPFGGAKSGIVVDAKKISREKKEAIIRSFSRYLRAFSPKYYIAAPDMSTGEQEMQWFADENGSWKSATGKPAKYCLESFGGKDKKCGIPHEFGSTGFGVAEATRVAADFAGLNIRGATVAIAGFGNVGSFAAKYLGEMGAQVVAVSDSRGAITSDNGMDFKKLIAIKNKGGSVTEYPKGKKIALDKIYELDVDILIPASSPDVINSKNVNKVRAKIISEGANISIPDDFAETLHNKGILIVPDIVANAGGVISSYAEYRGYNPKRMLETVRTRMIKNVRSVLKKTKKENKSPRGVAIKMARTKVLDSRSKSLIKR